MSPYLLMSSVATPMPRWLFSTPIMRMLEMKNYHRVTCVTCHVSRVRCQVSPEELVCAELVVDVHVVPPQLVVDGEHGPVVGVLALGQQLQHNITDELRCQLVLEKVPSEGS